MTAAQREKAGEFYMGFLEMLRGEEPGPLRKLLHYRNKGQFGEYLLEYAVTSRSIPGRFRAFQSCAVFSERCALDVPRRCGNCAVLRRGEVVRWLKAELDQRPVRYTSEQLERWAERLNSVRATRKKKRQHIAYVRRLTGGT